MTCIGVVGSNGSRRLWTTCSPIELILLSISKRTSLDEFLILIIVKQISHVEALQIWELLSSTTMWFIWKARCKKVFKGSKTPPAETVSAIWLELVLTLRSQFESIIGDSDVAEQRRLHFHKTWTPTPFYFWRESTITWKYHPPRWIFPPPITWWVELWKTELLQPLVHWRKSGGHYLLCWTRPQVTQMCVFYGEVGTRILGCLYNYPFQGFIWMLFDQLPIPKHCIRLTRISGNKIEIYTRKEQPFVFYICLRRKIILVTNAKFREYHSREYEFYS